MVSGKRIVYRCASIICIVVAVWLFTSCVSTSLVNIEVLKPSAAKLNHSIRKIVLVNSSYQRKYTSVINKRVRFARDSVKASLSERCIDGFLQIVQPASRFDTIVLYNTDKEIRLAEARAIAKKFNAGGVICLYSSNVTICNIVLESLFNGDRYVSQCDLKSDFTWKLFDARKNEFVDEFFFEYGDSWTGGGQTFKEAMKSIPDEAAMTEELYEYAGKWAGEQLIPAWEKESRMFYSAGSRELKTAGREALSNNWDQAEIIWKTCEGSTNKRLAARAAYNMALANELNGKIDEAFDMATKCYKEYGDPNAKAYSNMLHKRRMDQFLLNRQLNPGLSQ